MKKIVIVALCSLISTVLMAQDITGSWAGKLQIQNTQLGIVFHIEKKDSVYETKMDSPDQGAFGLNTSKTHFSGNQLEITASGMGITYTGTFHNDSITGIFRQGGMQFPLVLKPSQEKLMSRPQEPKPPFPYPTKDVTFTNESSGNILSGTLTTPASTGLFPAVILIAGSGPNDRDETVFGHKPFLVIADYLTRNGYSVLRYDKRGVGKSNGDYANATIQDFASDAAAALAFLKSQGNIDKNRIALIGHSEGGTIAPMVAANDTSVAAIVLMAGMGVKGSELMIQQNTDLLKVAHVSQDVIDKVKVALEEIYASIQNWENSDDEQKKLRSRIGEIWELLPASSQKTSNKEQYVTANMRVIIQPSYRYFLSEIPTEYIEKVQCPVFAVNGEKDIQVEAQQNLQAIREALEKGGNKDYTIKAYPGLNHLFQECETGSVQEYGKIEQTISPQLLSDMTDWLKHVFH